MTCKINHSDPAEIPEFLCRKCHPELVTTPERRAMLDALDRAAQDAKRKRSP